MTTEDLLHEIHRHHVPVVESVSDGLLERYAHWEEKHCVIGCSHYLIDNSKVLLCINIFPQYGDEFYLGQISLREEEEDRWIYSGLFETVEEAKSEMLGVVRAYFSVVPAEPRGDPADHGLVY
jgi:hypothetical protein